MKWRTLRRWLCCGQMALLCLGWGLSGLSWADDGEPIFPNQAQLGSIVVGGVAAVYPRGDLAGEIERVTTGTVQIGHCAPLSMTLRLMVGLAEWNTVSTQGQSMNLYSRYNPSWTLDVPLQFGANTLEIATQSQGYQVFYTVPVEREGPGSNTEIAALALSSGSLQPAFDPAVYHYSATVRDRSVWLTPTAADCPALTVNGQAVGSGQAIEVPLNLGANTVTLQAQAQDGSLRSYVLTLTREASAVAGLQALGLSAGTLSPAFDGAVTDYAVTVPYATAQLGLTLSPSVSTAGLSIDGSPVTAGQAALVPLQPGLNTLQIRVEAEDGSAYKIYTLRVTRDAPDTNARLASLGLSVGTLKPAFDAGVTQYSASVAHAVDALTVTPTPAFSGASVAVNGTPAGATGVTVPLQVGYNTITVLSTAQDGVTQLGTTLRVLRADAVQGAGLTGLALSSGQPWPPVHPAILSYQSRAGADSKTLQLTPTLEDALATVRINGGPSLSSGEGSAALDLQPGHNNVVIDVTSSDGVQTRRYSLDVLRGQAEAGLSALTLSDGVLSPAFDAQQLSYSAQVPYERSSVRLGATLSDPAARLWLGRRALLSGHAAEVALRPGLNQVVLRVRSSDDQVERRVTVSITRGAPQAQSLADHPMRFADPVRLELAGGWVKQLQAADLDGDGRPEGLAMEYVNPAVARFVPQADGRFAAAQWVSAELGRPEWMAVGDVHGDGWPDLLVTDPAQQRLLVGMGAGRLDLHPDTGSASPALSGPIALLDLDGDGLDDLLEPLGTGVALRRSRGDGHFEPARRLGSLDSVRHVLAADLNHDGQTDLLLASQYGGLQWLPGRAGLVFDTPIPVALPGSLSAAPRLADLDRDGLDDLVTLSDVDGVPTVSVLRGLPEGGLAAAESYPAIEPFAYGAIPGRDMVLGDFNGDGHVDALVLVVHLAYGYSLYGLAGTGDGRLGSPQRLPAAAGFSMMAVADVDGDGKPDLLTDRYIGVGGGLSYLRNTTPDLARLQPSSGTLSPAFSGDTLDYELSLPYGGPDVRLTPWLAFGNARLSLDGAALASGNASAPLAVPAGGRVPVTIEVQSRDGSTRRYTVTLSRALARTETRLSGLAPSVGVLRPAFDPDTLSYALELAAGIDSIRLRPSLVDASASVQVNGRSVAGGSLSDPLALSLGRNLITVQVTAEGGARRSYELSVWRQAPVVQASTAVTGGRIEAGVSGGGAGCGFARSQFVGADSVASARPSGVHFPHPLFDFSVEGCTPGATLQFSVRYPAPLPAGTRYWKWGPTPDQATPHWYEMPATIDGDTVQFSITDGGLGDDDFALGPNGTVIDAGGVGVPASVEPQPVPALPAHALGALAACLGLLAALGPLRRGRARR